MKKVLALVLAVVLAFGMTTVAFAADKSKEVRFADSGTETVLYTIEGDDDVMTPYTRSFLLANKEYFVKLVSFDPANDAVDMSRLSTLNDVKVRASIDEGASYIAAKPSFVIKADKKGGKKEAYVTFKTADKFQMEAVDLDMDITLYNKDGKEADVYPINKTVGYDESTAKTYFKVGGPVVNFDDIEDDTEMEFDKDVTFVVNAEGQKDLFLRMDDSDDALEDKYPEAALDIRYFAGNNKTFRRSGTLTIPADMIEGKDGKLVAPFIYENNKGKLSVCKDAKYDEDKEAFIIKTNKLGNYVISDKELKAEEAKDDDKKTDDKDGAEKNPDTGANDFVGLAVALAVVSVAGIAVAKRK